MTITTPEPISRPKAVSSGQIVPFTPELDPAIYFSPEEDERSRNPRASVRAADSYAVTDPIEYFLYSVISGAAVVSVLLGILSLPNVDPAKSGRLTTGTSQALESSLLPENRG